MSAATKIRRVAFWLLVGIASAVALVAAVLVLGVTTPQGTRIAISWGLSRSPVPVAIESIEGRLIGPLTLSGIEVENLGIRTRVDRVVVDWEPLQLLRRRVVVDSLHLTGIDVLVPEDYEAPPSEAGQEGPPEVPELPVEIDVRDLRVEVVRVLVEGRGELRESVLAGSGSLDAFDMAAELHGAAGSVESFEARSTLTGSPERYELNGDFSFVSPDLPPVRATLSASGSLSEIVVHEARVSTANGVAEATARATWYPAVSWDVEAAANGLEVAPFTPTPEEWPGVVSFSARSDGRLENERIEASVLVEDVSGDLREQPLSGGLELTVAGDSVVLSRLGLSWGGLRADAEGALVETLDLTFALDVPDLGLAVPGASGSARADGTLVGTRAAPHLVASFEARDLVRDSMSLGQAGGAIDLDLAAEAESTIDIRVVQIASGETTTDSVVLAVAGTREAHQARLAAWAPSAAVSLGVSGSISGSDPADVAALVWTGSVDTLGVASEVAGVWSLQAPASLVAGADSAALREACLSRLAASLCVSGAWQPDGAAAGELRIEALPLATMASGLPEEMSVEGTVDGEARFSVAADGALSADGNVRVSDGAIETTVGVDTVRFALAGDGLRLVVDDTGGLAEADFALLPEIGTGSVEATATVGLPGYTSLAIPLEEQSLEGRIEAGSDDLSFLSAFAPAVSNAGGRMQLEAALSGTAMEPTIQGSLVVEEGRGDVVALGLELREGGLRASGDAEGGIQFVGSVRSGEGQFSVEGRSPAVPTPEQPAELTLVGERFLAIATPEIQVEIESDLEVRHDGTVTFVEGRVAVPWARVELLEIPPAAVSPSPDVVFVDEESPPPPQVDARVEVTVGNDVSFQGFGFTSMIEGDVEVREEPGNPPLVLGELRFVDGRYVAYGQNLEVEPGRLIFSGPAEDVALDVTAVREAQDGTTAGLVVRGNVVEPEIEIISDPAMSDVDALSYIMYGTALSEGDPSQQGQVAGAAATLGANVLTTRLASSVGLDEARIEGTTRDQAELVAGKYLTPNVYVSYGMGLFRPSSTFRVKYLLSSSWAVQAESGDANGGDVLYQIERGP